MVKTIGKYELHRTLGEGSFGKVKYAVNKETNEAVAIKVLDKDMLRKKNMSVQIKREISLMRMINHKHVISIKDVFATATKIFMVLELVEGGELFDKIVEKGKFTEAEARFYMRQIIDGMECCHNQGICHRDLKPENLLLDADGNLKISDFGMARLYIGDPDAAGEARAELLHTTCGTPNYVAPEVLTCQGYDGQKADVWSMGVILYVLLAGYLPFEESTTAALFKKIKTASFEIPKWFSDSIRDLLTHILVVDPDQRISLRELKYSPWMMKDDVSDIPPFPKVAKVHKHDILGSDEDEDKDTKEREPRVDDSNSQLMSSPPPPPNSGSASASVSSKSNSNSIASAPAPGHTNTASSPVASPSSTPASPAAAIISPALNGSQPTSGANHSSKSVTISPPAATTVESKSSSEALVPTVVRDAPNPNSVNALSAVDSDEALVPTVIKSPQLNIQGISLTTSGAPPSSPVVPVPQPSPRGVSVNRIPSYDVTGKSPVSASIAVRKVEYAASVRPSSPLPVMETTPPAVATSSTNTTTTTTSSSSPAPVVETPAPTTPARNPNDPSIETPVLSPGTGTPVREATTPGAKPTLRIDPETPAHMNELPVESSGTTELSATAGIFECICNPFSTFSGKGSGVRLQ